MSNKSLKIVKQYSYLRIIIDHHLSWEPQVNQICNKVTRLLGFLKHNLQNCSQALKELNYKQFIFPEIQYTVAVWDLYHLKDTNKMEMVQHRAARYVLNRPFIYLFILLRLYSTSAEGL